MFSRTAGPKQGVPCEKSKYFSHSRVKTGRALLEIYIHLSQSARASAEDASQHGVCCCSNAVTTPEPCVRVPVLHQAGQATCSVTKSCSDTEHCADQQQYNYADCAYLTLNKEPLEVVHT